MEVKSRKQQRLKEVVKFGTSLLDLFIINTGYGKKTSVTFVVPILGLDEFYEITLEIMLFMDVKIEDTCYVRARAKPKVVTIDEKIVTCESVWNDALDVNKSQKIIITLPAMEWSSAYATAMEIENPGSSTLLKRKKGN